jgi:hypothetical protein
MVKTSNINNKGKRRKSAKLISGPGHDCMFPFKFKGKVYDNECVKGDTGDWCATSKTKNNYTDAWGYCLNADPPPNPIPKTPRKSSSSRGSTASEQELDELDLELEPAPKSPSPLFLNIDNNGDKLIQKKFDNVIAKITYDTPANYNSKSLILGHKKGSKKGQREWLIMKPHMNPHKNTFQISFVSLEGALAYYKIQRGLLNKKYEVTYLEGMDDEEIQNKIQELKYSPVDITKCKNDTNDIGIGEEWTDVENEKIIQLNNGNCYHIDEFAQYIISQKGKNVDPLNSLAGIHAPLWDNESELLEIRNFPGIDPGMIKEFRNVMDKTLNMLRMPPYARFLNTPKGQEFMDKLIVTGKICIEDYTGDYDAAQLELTRIREYIKDDLTSEERDMIKEISTFNGLKVEGTLIKDTGDTCIHGIGFQVQSLYFSAFIKTRQIYKDLGEAFNLTLHKGIVDLGNDVFIFCHGGQLSSHKGGINYPLTGLIFNTKMLTHNGERNGGAGRLVDIAQNGKITLGSIWGFNTQYAQEKIKDYKNHLHDLKNTDKDNILNIFADRPQGEKPHGKLSPIVNCKKKTHDFTNIINKFNRTKNKFKNLKKDGRMIKITGTGSQNVDGIYAELKALTNKKEAYTKIGPWPTYLYNNIFHQFDMQYFSYCKFYNDWRAQSGKDFKKTNYLGNIRYLNNKPMLENKGYLQNTQWQFWENDKWELNENIQIKRYPEEDEDDPEPGEKGYQSSSSKRDSKSSDNSDKPVDPVDQQVELTNEEVADLKARNKLPFGGNLQEAMKAQDRGAIKTLIRARGIDAKLLDNKSKSGSPKPQKKDLTNGEIVGLKAKHKLPYNGNLQEAMKAQDRDAIKILMKARNLTAKKKSSSNSSTKQNPKLKSSSSQRKTAKLSSSENSPGINLKIVKNIHILNNLKKSKLSSSEKPAKTKSPSPLNNKQKEEINNIINNEINNDINYKNKLNTNHIIIKKKSSKKVLAPIDSDDERKMRIRYYYKGIDPNQNPNLPKPKVKKTKPQSSSPRKKTSKKSTP